MDITINKEIIKKYDVSGPRYTSYPTAPQWDDSVNEQIYKDKLSTFAENNKTLSLYFHIPFCQSLCRYCGCNVIIRKQEERFGDEYIEYLIKEMDLVVGIVGKDQVVRQLHWGGGTPTFLSETQIELLFNAIKERFDLDLSGEIAIEIDPRTINRSKLDKLKRLGFNRVSLGVQDFNNEVQHEVNRVQPYNNVNNINDWCRELGFSSINFDLIYGLPLQTPQTFKDTMQKVIDMKPDRIALYSYAHVPWLKKHQKLIDEKSLPDRDEKLEIFLESREQFLNNGYEAIAMDHFALKDDELAKAYHDECLYRNFMGYTVKPADEYLGFGITSIGFLEKTFFQNHKVLKDYYQSLDQGQLPIERGLVLSQDDIIRQWTIQSLMCHFKINTKVFEGQFKENFDEYFSYEINHLHNCIQSGLLKREGDVLKVTELGKVFIRNICMGFDIYLRKNKKVKYSKTI